MKTNTLTFGEVGENRAIYDIEISHLEYLSGEEVLKLIETSKAMHNKYNGQCRLWKFIFDNEFGKIRCACCVPKDYKLKYISNKFQKV